MISKRIKRLPASSTVRIADLAIELRRQGEDVIDLSAGRAAEATAAPICDAAIAAMRAGHTHQGPARGIQPYLDAVTDKLERDNGLNYDPSSEVIATLGCKNALTLALMTVLDPGDEVVIEDPCFVSYGPTIELAGGVPVVAPLDPEAGYRWSAETLESKITPKTRAILFCSPHNPLGVVHTRKDLEIIADIAVRHNLIVLADEIYEAVTWGGRKHLPIASLPGMKERTIGMMGMTKSYSMGGWRLGYSYGPAELIDKMAMVQGHVMTCASVINQHAGIVALSKEMTDTLRQTTWKEWGARCQFVAHSLNAMDLLKCEAPEGGFYVWLDISETGLGPTGFCQQLLKNYHVATVPGDSFGQLGSNFVRVTCVKSQSDVALAIDRIAKFVTDMKG
ncbi:MAG: pyridoxal phosphate-dependent aminotransferase [Pseudomonadota bacterium]